MSFLSAIGNAVGSVVEHLDPLPNLLEGACNALGLPKEISGALEVFIGAVTDDVACLTAGAGNLAQSLPADLARAAREAFERKPSEVSGYAVPVSADASQVSGQGAATAATSSACAAPGSASGPLDPLGLFETFTHGATPASGSTGASGSADVNELQYLYDHFDQLDCRCLPPDSISVTGLRDGHIDMDDLEHLSNSDSAPADVKRAVRYLMDHPDLYAKLARTDGAITRADLQIALEDAKAQPAPCNPPATTPCPTDAGGTPCSGGNTSPPPGLPSRTGGTSGTASSPGCGDDVSGQIQNILADPNLSIEEKIEAILMLVEKQLDGELQKDMSDLAKLQSDRKGLSSDDQAAQQDNNNSQQMLEYKIQKLVEREQSMFNLMSTIDSKFHEMANTAIQNMGRN